MARSSDSLPTSPLPFGADTHNHNAFRRFTTNLGDPENETKPSQQDYSSFVAAAQAEDVRSHRASASIAPSSVKDLPLGHKNLLRRHTILLWVASAVFEIGLVALTAGIVLCAVRAHEYNRDGGGKAAYVIIGVFGFTGMVGSAAVGWYIWRARKERAQLEKRWTADEEMKERRSIRERSRASEVLRSIKERERSLSRSRSRSRSRGRASHRPPPATGDERQYSELIPSFRAMTPTATQPPSIATEQATASDWTNRVDISHSSDSDFIRSSRQVENERLEREIFNHMSRPTTPTSPPSSPSPTTSGVLLGSSPTLLNSSSSPTNNPAPQSQPQPQPQIATSPSTHESTTLFDFTNITHPPPSPPPKSPLPALPNAPSSPLSARLRQHISAQSYGPGPSPSTQNTSVLDFSPVIDPTGGVHPAFRESGPFGLPPDLRSSPQKVNAAETGAVGNSSPSSPRQPASAGSPRQHTPAQTIHDSSPDTHSPTFLNSPPTNTHTDNTITSTHPPDHPLTSSQPSSPPPTQQNSNSGTDPTTASTLLNSASTPPDNTAQRPDLPPPTTSVNPTNTAERATTVAAQILTPAVPPRSPLRSTASQAFIRAGSGGLGSAQSDDNFLTMLSAGSDANSEDEARLAERRMRSSGRIGEWVGGVDEASRQRSLSRMGGRTALAVSDGRDEGERDEARPGEETTGIYLTGREDDPGSIAGRIRGWKGFRRLSGRRGGEGRDRI